MWERVLAVAWASALVVMMVLASQLREDSVDTTQWASLLAVGSQPPPAGSESIVGTTQDYGPYYGPQAYYDGDQARD